MTSDGITVTETSTDERNQETIELYNEVKPLLEKGMSLTKALKELGYHPAHQAWLYDLTHYAIERGYVIK